MSEDKSSKKHPATPHKKKEARKKGNVAKSQDVGVAVGLVAGFGVVALMHDFYLKNFYISMTYCVEQIRYIPGWKPEEIPGEVGMLCLFVLKQVALLSLPVLFSVMIVAVVAQLAQVGIIVTGEQIKPKLSKINPLKGIKKWFAVKSLVELVKSLMKIAVAMGIGALVLWGEVETIVNAVNVSPDVVGMKALMDVTAGIISEMVWKIVILLVVIAVLDMLFQRYQWAKDLKMSDKEIKDEYKQSEGDPYQKARRRQIHQQMMSEGSSEHVPTSDVVVINPTDFAVALKYDTNLSPVPFVIAKGEARHADKLREIAKKSGVPIVRNKPLARALHELCEIGDIVPAELYKPVAEVLAYVFALKENTAEASTPAASSAAASPVAAGALNSSAQPHALAGDTNHG